jgi:tetratricopeptide (TPR) repeat protein
MSRPSPRAGALLVALLLLCLPSLAFADKATDARRAKALFEEGIALSDDGKWADALESFQKSDALVPSATVRFNIGASQRALGKYVDAKHTLLKILASAKSAKPPLKPALKKDVEKLLDEVKEKIITVAIHPTPSDADVEVDGAVISALPDGRLELDVGRHVFVATAEGYETTTVTKTLTASDTEVEIVLPKVKVIEVVVPAETPFYGRAWFLTTAGAVVVGTAAVIIILAAQPKPTPPLGPPPSTVDRVIPAAIRF